MNIAYSIGNSLYLNITNQCPLNCRFCIRNDGEGINQGESLWFDTEPSLDEILDTLNGVDFAKYVEVVFCGYGEPTCRLDVLLKCAELLASKNIPIRLNTNGLSDLINGKETVPLLAKHIDTLSISLNAPDAKSYIEMCNPDTKVLTGCPYDAMLKFACECKHNKNITTTVLSVVGHALSASDIRKCQDICDTMDIPLRVR